MNLALTLTYSRIVLTPIFMFFVLLNSSNSQMYAIIIFTIASITDILDGYIARITNKVTSLGAIMDPIADKFLVTSALVVLVEKGLLASWIVVIIIFREFFISGLRIFASQRHMNISAHFSGKIKTVLQMMMVILLIARYQYAWIFVYLTLLITIYSGIEYTIKYTYFLKKNSIEDKLKRVHTLLKDKKLTISICESCTGGLLGAYLSKLPGSSVFFKGGIISYQTQIKENLLKIDREIVTKKGVVSKEVARLMSEKIKEMFNSNIGISITGIAGPTKGEGVDKDKPVGLVYIGISYNKKTHIEKFSFSGNRDMVRIRACEEALRLIEKIITEEF